MTPGFFFFFFKEIAVTSPDLINRKEISLWELYKLN